MMMLYTPARAAQICLYENVHPYIEAIKESKRLSEDEKVENIAMLASFKNVYDSEECVCALDELSRCFK